MPYIHFGYDPRRDTGGLIRKTGWWSFLAVRLVPWAPRSSQAIGVVLVAGTLLFFVAGGAGVGFVRRTLSERLLENGDYRRLRPLASAFRGDLDGDITPSI